MTEEQRERDRLEYIQESIGRIEAYLNQGGREAFIGEPMVQDAVLRRLETLADAAGKLSDALKARHPEISWRQVHGFRNIAAHAYEFIDLARAWEIIEDHLPALKIVVNDELRRAAGA